VNHHEHPTDGGPKTAEFHHRRHVQLRKPVCSTWATSERLPRLIPYPISARLTSKLRSCSYRYIQHLFFPHDTPDNSSWTLPGPLPLSLHAPIPFVCVRVLAEPTGLTCAMGFRVHADPSLLPMARVQHHGNPCVSASAAHCVSRVIRYVSCFQHMKTFQHIISGPSNGRLLLLRCVYLVLASC
jgi:hypothetical protein